jgi:hypothetical protein
LLTDTLSNPLTKILAGAAPIAVAAEQTSTIQSIGHEITNYGGALLASTLIHLAITLGTKLLKLIKSKTKTKINGNSENNQTEVTKTTN